MNINAKDLILGYSDSRYRARGEDEYVVSQSWEEGELKDKQQYKSSALENKQSDAQVLTGAKEMRHACANLVKT